MHGERMKADILRAGLALWPNVTARAVGKRVRLSHAGVLYHFPGGIDALRWAVAEEAVRVGDPVVVPQLITTNHPAVSHMDAATRQDWLLKVR